MFFQFGDIKYIFVNWGQIKRNSIWFSLLPNQSLDFIPLLKTMYCFFVYLHKIIESILFFSIFFLWAFKTVDVSTNHLFQKGYNCFLLNINEIINFLTPFLNSFAQFLHCILNKETRSDANSILCPCYSQGRQTHKQNSGVPHS